MVPPRDSLILYMGNANASEFVTVEMKFRHLHSGDEVFNFHNFLISNIL